MITIKIEGMSCGHCVLAVTEALTAVEGVTDVRIDLERGEASFEDDPSVDPDAVKEAVRKAGYRIG